MGVRGLAVTGEFDMSASWIAFSSQISEKNGRGGLG
jgi:hypothetical protein